jgi:menaquinone-dependent protoporphyrinogen IX oxidase
MKYTIVYWSRYGHNKKIVKYLAEKLKEKKAKNPDFNNWRSRSHRFT